VNHELSTYIRTFLWSASCCFEGFFSKQKMRTFLIVPSMVDAFSHMKGRKINVRIFHAFVRGHVFRLSASKSALKKRAVVVTFQWLFFLMDENRGSPFGMSNLTGIRDFLDTLAFVYRALLGYRGAEKYSTMPRSSFYTSAPNLAAKWQQIRSCFRTKKRRHFAALFSAPKWQRNGSVFSRPDATQNFFGAEIAPFLRLDAIQNPTPHYCVYEGNSMSLAILKT
jgi:hypothetical protein